jgi:predicted kinase
MRGLPGSGKSTVAKAIKSVYAKGAKKDFVICSADEYFIVEGSYQFDFSKLKDAHEFCKGKMKNAVQNFARTIIIDNTNIQYWEMKNYIQVANQEGYYTIIVEPKTPWRLNPEILSQMNKHGVQKEVLQKKISMFGPAIPLYFGWFLSTFDGKKLIDISKQLLKLCLLNCEKFRSDFEEFSSVENLNHQLRYYENLRENEMDKPLRLHCTAKFCKKIDGKHSSDVIDYASRPIVISSIGQLTKINIIGFVITKNTFGARIKLSDTQLELYEQNDDEVSEKYIHINQTNQSMLSNFEFVGSEEKSNLAEIRYLEKTTSFRPVVGKGSRAHITIGTASTIPNVQTGLDQLEAVELEKNSFPEKLYYNIFTYPIPSTSFILRRYKSDMWVLYKSGNKLLFDALFTGHYT